MENNDGISSHARNPIANEESHLERRILIPIAARDLLCGSGAPVDPSLRSG
jgi:hypothetical protein